MREKSDRATCIGASLEGAAKHRHVTCRGPKQAGEQPQQRGLPRPVRTRYRERLAGREREVEVTQHRHPAERAAQPPSLQRRYSRATGLMWRRRSAHRAHRGGTA